jgi:hypothetical protein
MSARAARRGRLASASGARPAAWLSAALLACAAWLYWPRHASSGPARWHVALVDVSDSCTRARPTWEAWVEQTLALGRERARADGAEFSALAFAVEVRPLAPDGAAASSGSFSGWWREQRGRLDTRGSDLASALELVRARLERREARLSALEVLSDGRFFGGDWLSALSAVEQAGGAAQPRLIQHRPPPRERANARLAHLSVPSAVSAAARARGTLELELEDETLAAETLWVEIERIDASGSARQRLPWSRRGPRSLSFELGQPAPGPFEVRARVELEGDPFPEDDRAVALGFAGDGPRLAVLCSSARAADAQVLARALAAPLASPVGVRPFAAAPAADDPIEAWIALDPSPRDLGQPWLASAVAGGAGLLVLCGEAALENGPAPTLAALWPAPNAREPRDVILLADGSGSMRGEAFEALRAAAARLAALVPQTDGLELRLFTTGLVGSPLRRAGDGSAFARALASLEPSGGSTDVLASLEQLARERASISPPRASLVVLLSDGRDQRAGQSAVSACLERLRESGVALELLAFGAQADVAFLSLLIGRARVPRALDGSGLERLLVRALTEERWFVPTRLELLAPPDQGAELGAASWARLLAELGAAPLPPQALGARAAADAQVLGWFQDRRAALAVARRGAGNCLALAGDVWDRPTGAAWLAGLAFGLSQAAAARSQRELRLELEEDELVLRGVPMDWPACVLLAGADGSQAELCLPTRAFGESVAALRRGAWPPGWAAMPLACSILDPSDGRTLARVALRGRSQAIESSAAVVDLAALWPDRPAGAPAPTERGAGPAAPLGSHAWAPWVLGLGLLSLALSSLGALRKGIQAPSRPGR